MKKLSIWIAMAYGLVVTAFAQGTNSINVHDHSRWMAELEQAAPAAMNQPLARFILPGSHDSGTYNMKPFLSCEGCKGADTFFNVVDKCNEYVGLGLSCDTFLSDVAIPWATTQNLTIKGQLEAGARSLDLRFFRATMADQMRTLGTLQAGHFYVHHTVAGPELPEILHDIKTFLEEPGHDREVIILRFYHLSEADQEGMSAASVQVLYNQVRAVLGSATCSTKSSCGYLAPAPNPTLCATDPTCVATARLGANATIREILDQGSQVIMTNPSDDVTGPDLWDNPTNPDPSFTSGYPTPDDADHPWRTDREFIAWLQDLAAERTSQSELFVMGVHIGLDDDAKALIRSYVCKLDPGIITDECPAPNHDWDHFSRLTEIAAYTNKMSLTALAQFPRDLVNVIHADLYSREFTEEVFKLNLGATRTAINIASVQELTSHDILGSPDYYPVFLYDNVPPVPWALRLLTYDQILNDASITPNWPGWKAYPNNWGFASINFGVYDADLGGDQASLINGNSALKTITMDISGCVLNAAACPSTGLLTTAGPSSNASGSSSVRYNYAACVWSWLPGQHVDPRSICNDDGNVTSPEVSILDVTQKEGTDSSPTKFEFIVTLTPPQREPIQVSYQLLDGSATYADDYVSEDGSPTGVITFNPGETQKSIIVKVTADSVGEADEDFQVKIIDSFPAKQNLNILDDTAVGSILNDDIDYQLSITNLSLPEGTACQTTPFNFTVRLSGPLEKAVTVHYATADGPAPNGAQAGSDYIAVPDTLLTFNPGETSKTVTVSVVCNDVIEPDETFFVRLSNPNRATLGNAVGTGTIRNDDDLLIGIIPAVSLYEGDSGTQDLDFSVNLSAPNATPITVNYRTLDGTATAGSDYEAVTSSVTFAPNTTVAHFTVKVYGDTQPEPDETFFVLLLSTSSGTIDLNRSQSIAIINNDDVNQPPTVTAGPFSVNEGSSVQLTATGNDPEQGPLTYAWDLNNDGSFETSGKQANFSAAQLDGLKEYTVKVRVTDNGNLSAIADVKVKVINVAPTATLTNNGPVNEGSPVTITFGNPSDPSTADTIAGFHYAYSCTNAPLTGATYANSNSTTSASCSFADNGSYTVRARIIDKDNGFTEHTTIVTVNDVPPSLTTPGNQVGSEGALAPFDFKLTDPGSDGPWTITVNWGDGSNDTYTVNATGGLTRNHTYADNGAYAVTVSAVDADHVTSNAIHFTATISNVNPTATLSNNGPIDEGGSATISFTGASDASSADMNAGLHYAYSCTNGSLSGTTYASSGASVSTSCPFDDNAGSHIVKARIMDKDGGFSEYTTTVVVNNLAPTATLTNNGPINEGGTATVSVTGQSDLSTADTAAGFHYAYSCTNGSLSGATYATSGTSTTTSCSFDDNAGPAIVKARIIDKDGGFSEYTTTIVVNNIAPSATLINNGPVNEGSPATIRFSGQIDPSIADTTAGFHYAYSCTNASLAGANYTASSGTLVNTSCIFPDNGIYTVRARIIDKDDGFTEYTTTVTVNNVAPTITTATGSTIDENAVATATVTFTDPGTLDTFILTVDWGDGSVNQYPLAAGTRSYTGTHQYLDDNPTGTPSDAYQVTVTIVDDDTGMSAARTAVTVKNAPPVVGSLITRNETGATISGALFALTGLNVNVAAAFTDAGTRDTHTGGFDWGDGTKGPGSVSESGGSGALSGSHSWSNPGNVTLMATVIDDDTGIGSRATTLSVLDPAGAVCALAGQVVALVNSSSGLDSSTIKALTQLAGKIQGNANGQAFNGACDMFAKGNNVAGAVKLTQAVQSIEDLLSGTTLNADQKAILRAVEGGLILTAKSTYLSLVQAAGQGNPSAVTRRKLADAAALATLADGAMAAGDRVAAIGYWTQAIRVLAPSA